RVRVGLQYTSDSVVLMIDDDGAGFDSSARQAPGSSGGYGLFGMEERARLLGGEVQIDSTPGWGTRIRASLPYRPMREGVEPRAPAAPVQTFTALPSVRPEAATPERYGNGARALRVLIADDHAIVRQG